MLLVNTLFFIYLQLCILVIGIPLFDTPPTFSPQYELVTQYELAKDKEPASLNHNMRFYAVSISEYSTLLCFVCYLFLHLIKETPSQGRVTVPSIGTFPNKVCTSIYIPLWLSILL